MVLGDGNDVFSASLVEKLYPGVGLELADSEAWNKGRKVLGTAYRPWPRVPVRKLAYYLELERVATPALGIRSSLIGSKYTVKRGTIASDHVVWKRGALQSSWVSHRTDATTINEWPETGCILVGWFIRH